MVQFSKEPNNLCNVNTFKHSGLATAKTISVQDGKYSARKHTLSSRITEIQEKLSERILELLVLPGDDVPLLLLDIGCGSGLSGETLSESGNQWIGLDISDSMLSEMMLRCSGMTWDSWMELLMVILASQWCRPVLKWHNFIAGHFLDHYISVYPERNDQLELILGFAKRAGFAVGVVVDFSPQEDGKKVNRFQVARIPPALFRNTGNQTMVFL
ncbi:hypothetical protein MKW98_007849 [Papaver atlanticum]|uniref:Uncharacterized protein n=1 Tax=Papaver atlanticum TaxID=357466 RepID=A0AAD4X4K6_9MAGN|nr:hypothetical protein MKW98_007849 [Papaver atlanticum]